MFYDFRQTGYKTLYKVVQNEPYDIPFNILVFW